MANNNNRNNNQQKRQAPVEQKKEVPVVAQEPTPAATPEAPLEVIDDTPQQAPADAEFVQAVAATVSEDVIEAATEAEGLSTDIRDGDSETLVTLKNLLVAYKKAREEASGSNPSDHRNAAALARDFTRHLIKFPRVEMLDTTLAFFEENKKGILSRDTMMMGSTTLNKVEEQQVGFLFNLFAELVSGTVQSMNAAVVTKVLSKPEFAGFYNRKVAAMKAVAAQQ